MNTIIYLTDNTLDEKLFKKCQEFLLKAAGDIPIISVSQKPIDFGTNICVGEIGRSWLSLYKQLLVGIEAVKTENIVICEHDCIYTHEHLSFTPPRKDTIYYNMNHWCVNWGDKKWPQYEGMYSYWPRRMPMSQLVTNRELLFEDTNLRLRTLTNPTDDVSVERAKMWARTGRSVSIGYLIAHKVPDHPHQRFATTIPNLDIRHASNFTGPKRGKKRCFELPPWGKFKDLIENNG